MLFLDGCGSNQDIGLQDEDISGIAGLQSLFFAMWFDMEYNKQLGARFGSK